jgi:DNA-binding response OmpR family regulator
MKILIVEDEPGISETLAMYLSTRADCKVTESVQGAMEILETERPDVILLDIWLNGEFGTPIIGIARDWYSDRPPTIIVISAMVGAKRLAEQNNAEYFLDKPFDLEFLDEIIFGNCQKRIDESHYLR